VIGTTTFINTIFQSNQPYRRKKSRPFSHVNLLCPGCSWTPGMY